MRKAIRSVVYFLLACASISARSQGYIDPSNCYSFGAYSSCTASDNTRITCHNGGYKQCTIEHSNGVSSNPRIGTVAISLIVSAIAQHKTHKAEEYFTRTTSLDLQGLVVLSDLTSYRHKYHETLIAAANMGNQGSLSSQLPEVAQKYEQQTAEMDQLATQTAQGVQQNYQLEQEGRVFYGNHRLWTDLYGLSVQSACLWRSSAVKERQKAEVFFKQISATGSPAASEWVRHLTPLLDNLRNDAALLDGPCTSKEALKILTKAKKQAPAAAQPTGTSQPVVSPTPTPAVPDRVPE